MSPYLSGIKIYSDSPILLYSAPFEKMENIPLEDEQLDALLSSKTAGIRLAGCHG